MNHLTIPTLSDCPMCGRPLHTAMRFCDDGVCLIARVCSDCGEISPVETAPASGLINDTREIAA